MTISEIKSQFCVKALVVLLTIDDDEDEDEAVVDGNNGDDDRDELGRIDWGLFAFDVLENDIDDKGNCWIFWMVSKTL